MRVIAGIYRRRQLKEADQAATRPTTDKNREMVFNVLGQYFDGGTALDLYAGTGAMGIEALSRGIAKCIFVDNDKTAIRTISDNLDALAVPASVGMAVQKDALAWLAMHADMRFDLVFLDPPYDLGAGPEVIAFLAEQKMLLETGVIVAETARAFTNEKQIGGLALVREIPAGSAKFAFYRWGDQS